MRLILLFVAAFISLANDSVFATDSSCTEMIKATIPNPKVPYHVLQTVMRNGQAVTRESIYFGGAMFVHISPSSPWLRVDLSSNDLALLVVQAEKTTSNCVSGATELVGNVRTLVWTSDTMNPVLKKKVTQKLWIGVADGRVYRQSIGTTDQVFSYQNVEAPKNVGGSSH